MSKIDYQSLTLAAKGLLFEYAEANRQDTCEYTKNSRRVEACGVWRLWSVATHDCFLPADYNKLSDLVNSV